MEMKSNAGFLLSMLALAWGTVACDGLTDPPTPRTQPSSSGSDSGAGKSEGKTPTQESRPAQ